MKKVLSLVILSIFTLLPLNAATFQGGVAEQGSGNASRIIDKQTGEGVGGADIRLPKQNYSTRTDSSGFFELDTQINGPSIMSVQKENYKPFTMTINDKTFDAPIVVGIENLTLLIWHLTPTCTIWVMTVTQIYLLTQASLECRQSALFTQKGLR